jgi:hypothetical protein
MDRGGETCSVDRLSNCRNSSNKRYVFERYLSSMRKQAHRCLNYAPVCLNNLHSCTHYTPKNIRHADRRRSAPETEAITNFLNLKANRPSDERNIYRH